MASQVTVVVRIRAKPETRTRVDQELLKLLAPTRVETGCINYDMHRSQTDDSLFFFYENWVSEADLKRHFEAPHIKHWLAQAEALLAEPMELTLWDKVG